MNDCRIHQGLLDTFHTTGKYRPAWVISNNCTIQGNRAHYRQTHDCKHEYIFRMDVWSDSKNKFILTRWYNEIGNVPYLETEYNEG